VRSARGLFAEAAAGKRDLRDEVRAGRFREDFIIGRAVVELRVPPPTCRA
jgi:transcriptional regulator with GAF, ATPase, and Fis domain